MQAPNGAAPLPVVEPVVIANLSPDAAKKLNDARPFSTAPLLSARSFLFPGVPEDRARARDCMAAAAWYEAGDDPVGQSAVVQVILNRVRHPAFPKSICAVVFEGAERSTGCQFTFTCDGAMVRRQPSPEAIVRAEAIAEAGLSGAINTRVGLSTHYHTEYVVPNWSATLDKVSRLGGHIFFRWPGYWGTPGAFRPLRAVQEMAVEKLAALFPAHRALDDAGLAGAEPGNASVAGLDARGPNFPKDAAVGTRDLRGSRVISADPTSTRYTLALGSDASGNGYPLAALAVCRGRPICRVEGWRTPADAKTPAAGPSFVYDRRADGGETIKWNCAEVARPVRDQCL